MSSEAKVDKTFIAGVIPVMDAITRQFDLWNVGAGLEKTAIRYGIRRGQELLNRYYSKTDESVLYRIALRKLKLLSGCERSLKAERTFSSSSWISCRVHASSEMARGMDHRGQTSWSRDVGGVLSPSRGAKGR